MVKHFLSFIPWSIQDICSVNDLETESRAQNIGNYLLKEFLFSGAVNSRQLMFMFVRSGANE